jgi:hypothetical protein
LQTEATSPFPREERELQQRVSSGESASSRGVGSMPSCLVCGGMRLSRLHRTPHQVLHRCKDCRLVFGWPVFSREALLEYNAIRFAARDSFETAGYFDRPRVD